MCCMVLSLAMYLYITFQRYFILCGLKCSLKADFTCSMQDIVIAIMMYTNSHGNRRIFVIEIAMNKSRFFSRHSHCVKRIVHITVINMYLRVCIGTLCPNTN